MAKDTAKKPSPPPPENWRYANYFQVGETENELVIDFALHFEGMDEPCWHTRIILSKSAAQELAKIVGSTLQSPSTFPVQ